MKRKSTKLSQQSSQGKTLYEMQADICSALASPVRLHILDLLSEGEKTASELLNDLSVPKANLSQHLAVLKDAGIIRARKEGLYQYISLSIPKIKDACSLVKGILIEKIENEEKVNLEIKKRLKGQR